MEIKLDVIKHIFNNVIYGICSGKSLVCVQGSARSGKTYNIIILLIQCCLNPDFAKNLVVAYFNTKRKEEKWDEHPDVLENKAKELQVIISKKTVDVSVIRYALPSLKRSVFKDFVEIMCKMGIYDQKCMNKTEMVYTFSNGSTFEFFATADNEQKIRGSKRDIAFINEGNEIGGDEFSQLRMRTSMFTIVDYNPSFTDEHWLYKLLDDVRTYRFVSTFENNPFLSDAIKDEIRSYKFTNPALWSVFGLGEFAIVEGLVFPKGTWDTCSMEEIPQDASTGLGMDIGYSGKGDPNAVVQVWTKNIGGVKHMWINEVLYERGLNEMQMVQRLRPYNDLRKFIDSANPLYIQNFEDAGAKLVYPVKKYNNSVSEGIRAMQGYKIHIIKTSVEIIKELKNYVWQKDRHGNYTDVPIDKFNHCFTGDTLVTTMNGNVRIDAINEGDMVLTRKGWMPVLKFFANGKQHVNLYEIHAHDGDKKRVIKIKATPTHKVKTNIGWKQIDNLSKGDIIYLSDIWQIFAFELAEIVSVKKVEIGERETYNLMIDKHHEYVANGLLVSNCIDAARYFIMMDRSGRSDRRSVYTKSELGLIF